MIQTNYEVVFITIKGGLKWKKLFSRTKSECIAGFAAAQCRNLQTIWASAYRQFPCLLYTSDAADEL